MQLIFSNQVIGTLGLINSQIRQRKDKKYIYLPSSVGAIILFVAIFHKLTHKRLFDETQIKIYLNLICSHQMSDPMAFVTGNKS